MGRLFEILYYLMRVKKTTAKELSEHFEVSVRTIYRDLDRLLVAGIPIETTQGANGGISIDEHYVLDKSLLNDHQQEHILLALETLSALNIQDDQNISQLLQLTFDKKSLNWIDIDFSSWHVNQELDKKFEILKEAIFKKEYISFSYINMHNQKSNKFVEPMQLIFKSNSWYLKGFDMDKQKERIYKLKRMSSLNQSGRYFLKRHISSLVPSYQEDYSLIDVIFIVDHSLGSFVFDEFPYQDITEVDTGYLVQTQMKDGPWLLSLLLSFGKHIQIIKPLELQEKLLKEIDEIKNIYVKSDR